MNKLYLLRPKKGQDLGYDCFYGFVIEASSAKTARKLAQNRGGDECGLRKDVLFWADPKKSTCKVLKPGEKESKIVISDFNAG